ncbi:MAG: GntR family transcriptional regulator, partial [Acidobacteria bacterium]
MSAGGTRRDRVYRALRSDLMTGVLPPDTRLGEERLAEQYGVSRTPVREALARLVSDGLVERREQGLFPYRPRFDDLADLYELRTTLELRGIRRALADHS